MLSGLKLWNFTSKNSASLIPGISTFVLKTCQRTLVLSYERYPFENQHLDQHELHTGKDAYLFLLETICGLKSKLIGENEIVGQFKESYQNFVSTTQKDTRLLVILEKLFKDAKDIRTQYLIGISQKTYASIARKHIIQKAHAKHVVIVGSGTLAEDLINQFKKKARVSICARNSERVAELVATHQIESIAWEERSCLTNEAWIANTVGASEVLFDETFFAEWKKSHPNATFVDLGSPSVIETSLTLKDGIVRLDDIFAEGAIVEGQKQQQIGLARAAMIDITHKREILFAAKLANKTLIPPQINQDVRYL